MNEFLQTLHNMSIATAIRESALVYPIILSTHLTAMLLFGGMILLTDLRLLGVAMTDRPVTAVVDQLRPWKHLGLTIAVICGVLMGWSKIAIYWPNPYFKTKLVLLVLVTIHAILFRPSVYSKTAEMDRTKVIPPVAKTAAVISLVLWISLVTMGRMIGYWEGPSDRT